MGKREVRKNLTRKQTGGFGLFGFNLFGTGNTTGEPEKQPEKGGFSFFSPSSWFSNKKAETDTENTPTVSTETAETADTNTTNSTDDSSLSNQAGGKRKSKRSNKQKNKKTKQRRKCKGKNI